MKHLAYLILAVCLLSSCGTSKRITAPEQPPTPPVVTESKVEVPTPPQPQIEDNTVITPDETPDETPKEIMEETMEKEIPAVVVVEEVPVIEVVDTSVDHSALNTLLATHVTPAGNVNYDAIKKNWAALRGYIASLGTQLPEDSWSQEEKLAYWMNAYNAMTIDLILRNYPLASIKDIKDPWDQRLWKLGAKWYNLNEIEHQILRKMGDARIHFGINCASFSCPPLPNEAFTAATVDAQLEQLAKTFVNDPQRNTIAADRVDVSKIFNWFSKDFKTEGSLVDFLNKYATTQIDPNAKVRYRDYDWTLNK